MTHEHTGTTTPTPASTAPVRTGSTDMTARIPNTSGVGGTTKIADSVVSRIAALATREVPGVHDLTGTGLAQAFGGFAGRMTGQAPVDQGVAVQVGEVESPARPHTPLGPRRGDCRAHSVPAGPVARPDPAAAR